MEPFRIHLFLCTQQKPEGVPSCPASGSFAVLESLDREIQARHIDGEVQLTTSGCMGLCDEGPIMVAYPAGVWYRRVKASDVPEIIDSHLSGGKPVERLVWNDAPAMQAMAVEHTEKFRAGMAARDKAGTLPDRFEQMIRAYQPSRCLLTALELDVFTAVGAGAGAAEVAKRIGASPRGVSILLNALVALGMLQKSGEQYKNTPESARFFVQGSKDNHRDGLLHMANIWQRWSTLTEAVRSGTRVPIEQDGNPEWTRNFINAMQRNAKDRAPLLVKTLGTAGIRRVLDPGGGSGAYSIAFAKASPEIHCDILDVPEVIPLTRDYVQQAGVSGQVQLRAGDMLSDDFGTGYDLVLLNAICHMFSEEQNRDLFRRAYQALATKGRLSVADFVLDPDKTRPAPAALFSLNMLVNTDAGASYSEPEYTDWMKAAGFADVSRMNMPGPGSIILGTKRS
ncbi:MAG TPA: methyltransferase [Dongiaceae bacterium]|nr:methyltransferase [Dongiaceae bacterium]